MCVYNVYIPEDYRMKPGGKHQGEFRRQCPWTLPEAAPASDECHLGSSTPQNSRKEWPIFESTLPSAFSFVPGQYKTKQHAENKTDRGKFYSVLSFRRIPAKYIRLFQVYRFPFTSIHHSRPTLCHCLGSKPSSVGPPQSLKMGMRPQAVAK